MLGPLYFALGNIHGLHRKCFAIYQPSIRGVYLIVAMDYVPLTVKSTDIVDEVNFVKDEASSNLFVMPF